MLGTQHQLFHLTDLLLFHYTTFSYRHAPTAQKFKGAVMKLVCWTSPFLGFGAVVKRTERSYVWL